MPFRAYSFIKLFIYLPPYGFKTSNMKILGLLITTIGILIVGGSFVFTPSHAFNAADSISGVNASAGLAYVGFITFGVGMVLFISTLPYAGEKSKA